MKKTPITYYGGTQQLADTIISMIPPHKIYCEPFFGGGAVFFAKGPSFLEVINDKNDLIVTFYRQCVENFERLQEKIQNTLHSESEYNKAKRIYNNPKHQSKLNVAWAVWVVTNMSIMATPRGGWKRDNGTGGSHTGVSMAAYRNNFTAAVYDRLKYVQISCRDAIDVIEERDSCETFFYLDPPYINCDQKHYSGYTKDDFKKLLDVLSGIKGKFMLSNFQSEILSQYTEDNRWFLRVIERKCMIPALINKPRRKQEVLVCNYRPYPSLFGEQESEWIGLVDIDGHASKKKWGATIYPNLALCKIAAWHKAQGDMVEWAIPMMQHYDIIYMSKIFNFTPDDERYYDADKVIRGGTGYDLYSKLPQEIDDMQPDYSIYPLLPKDTAYGFLTRGCPNKCKWCVVPRKEGAIKPYWDIERVANGRKKVVLMDNNILAAGSYCMEQLQKIIDFKLKVDFNQALDARLVTDDIARLLAKIKWLDNNRIRFGCDTHKQIEDCERAMDMINGYGFSGQYFLYTMLYGDFQECYDRINHWWVRMRQVREAHQGRQVYAYAQPYRNPDNPNNPIPQWQKDMAGWVNKKAHFVAHSFEDFEPRKGFRCSSYFTQKG